jgi:hypothetical protein
MLRIAKIGNPMRRAEGIEKSALVSEIAVPLARSRRERDIEVVWAILARLRILILLTKEKYRSMR